MLRKLLLRTFLASAGVAGIAFLLFEQQSPGTSSQELVATKTVRGGELQNTTTDSDDHRPPLSSLIGDLETNITGDVQFLLDIAIIGHPKTATSSMMRWFADHEEIQMYTREIRSLKNGKPAELVKYMYDLPTGSQYKRGYKDPRDICSPKSLVALGKYWPKTKLIVGLRHPVKWFESWYNFKVRQGNSLPPPEKMVKDALPDQVKFHDHLSMLGKTNALQDPNQLELLGNIRYKLESVPPLPNEVFLFDVSQPYDQNESRRELFRHDLSNFLGLHRPLDPPTIRTSSGKNYHFALNICNDTYTELRAELMQVGVAASKWIREYFLDHPNVTVSSSDHLQDILMTWLEDPCDASNQAIANPMKGMNQTHNDHNTPESQPESSTDLVEDRPPLSSLIGDSKTNITGDVQFLLDFAIVGHPKCATSSMMKMFAKHEETQMYDREVRSLMQGRPAEMVKLLYELPEGRQYKRGYKDPNDIGNPGSLVALGKYWPKTKLIVGIRHPVKWFESWYNFKARKGRTPKLSPEKMVGDALPYQVKYHTHLSLLGKTNILPDTAHDDLLNKYPDQSEVTIPPLPNKVFLYDVSQPYDLNSSRSELFRHDLSKFVGLKRTLDLPNFRTSPSPNYHYVLDICEDTYKQLREELVEVGVAASKWIRDYFLDHPDVTVSSPDQLRAILSTWSEDPCDTT